MIYAVAPYERFRKRVLEAAEADEMCPVLWSPEFVKWSGFDQAFVEERQRLHNEIYGLRTEATFNDIYLNQWTATAAVQFSYVEE